MKPPGFSRRAWRLHASSVADFTQRGLKSTHHNQHGRPKAAAIGSHEGNIKPISHNGRPPVDLIQMQCRIFNTIYNPTAQRLGNKVLRQRLRGPSLAAYYPRRVATFTSLQALYPDVEMYDQLEEERLEHIQIMKARGKGAPKKKKTATGEYTILVCSLTTYILADAGTESRRGGKKKK